MRVSIAATAAVVVAILTCAGMVSAQPITVRVAVGGVETQYGAAHTSTEDIRIDLGDVAALFPNFDYIRVLSADLSADINRITLFKSATGDVPMDVRLLVASPSVLVPTFPSDFFLNVGGACQDWGGTDSQPGPALVLENTVPEGTRVILAASVGGNIRGAVTCGQVFTLQARAGSISGNIHATAEDNPTSIGLSDVRDVNDPSDEYAIQFIQCRDGLSGSVIAGQTTPPTLSDPPPPPCSIRTIVVGQGVTNSQGIRGDIIAYGGHIRRVSSTGDIGTSTSPITIAAEWGLTELRCETAPRAAPGNTWPSLPRNVYANIRANWCNDAAMPPPPPHGAPHMVWLENDGWLRTIEVSGSLNGGIEANILRPPPTGMDNGYEESDPEGNTYGVFVGGACDSAMTIRHGVLVSSLAAASFGGAIDIETYVKGKIIARTGGIASLTIGNNPHMSPLPLSTAHGFIAAIQTPDWDNTGVVFPYTIDNEPEAIIRAHTSIAYLNISQMVQGTSWFPRWWNRPASTCCGWACCTTG